MAASETVLLPRDRGGWSNERVGHRPVFASARPVRDLLPVLGMSVNHHLDEAIIDFAPGRTTKWEALTSLGIEEYNAFGNDINDLDLLRNARHAVRVGAHAGLGGVAHVAVAADPEAVAAEIARLASVTPAAA